MRLLYVRAVFRPNDSWSIANLFTDSDLNIPVESKSTDQLNLTWGNQKVELTKEIFDKYYPKYTYVLKDGDDYYHNELPNFPEFYLIQNDYDYITQMQTFPVDAPVYVNYGGINGRWEKAHLAEVTPTTIKTWNNGKTSYTTEQSTAHDIVLPEVLI